MDYWDWKCQQAPPLPLRDWQHQGRESLPSSLIGFSICFHFVTRHFYLSCLKGYLNNSPTGLKEREADSEYAFILSPEHHSHVKTLSHTVRETGRTRHTQELCSQLPTPPVLPQPLMETELFVNPRCSLANKLRQLSSYGAKPMSSRAEEMAYSTHTFGLQSRNIYTHAQVPTQNALKLIPADPLGDCMVLAQGPSFCILKRRHTLE